MMPESNLPVLSLQKEPKLLLPEIDILIATDCISEGQNLQDCEKTTEELPASPVLNSRTFNEGFGFSETDPADQPSRYIAVTSRSYSRLFYVFISFFLCYFLF